MHTQIELKVLRIIYTLISCGTVTKTAKKLGLSTGTISYNLNIARKISGSHLFARTKSGMRPDTTALELGRRYQEYLHNYEMKADAPVEKIREHINCHTTSVMQMMLTNTLFRPGEITPPWRYQFKPFVSNVEHRLNKLKNRSIDIDIGSKLPADPEITSVRLFTSSVSVLMGKNNSQFGNKFTLDDWYQGKHIRWSEICDFYSKSILDSVEINNHIAKGSTNIVSCSLINMIACCSQTDHIMMIPDYFIPMLTEHFPVKCVPAPPELDILHDCFLNYNSQLREEHELIETLANLLTRINPRDNYENKS
ncbi:LysR family transcriptional regulator [Buttiauxella sp. B2]|uniref:LysR family transcriptional regulator n=1 Tax=Buttiauxella sp. B2 TaxID=2587812 RepID=UPI001124141B|nr:LysR family transcriptional regulator [Buttiauxella sp. B2]TNV20566.1 LysR family transcriptional regulator [Buttiauxella sp. B2]